MKDVSVTVYGKIASTQSFPESYEEYDKMAATSAFERALARDSAAWRAKVLKAAANAVEAESGLKQGTSKRGDKEVITESPTAYFDRLAATEDEEGNEVASLVSLSAIQAAIDKAAGETTLVSVLTPERVAGGSSIPACSEGIRARLQSIIDTGRFENNLAALDKVLENAKDTAEALGLTFELPEKVQAILADADYEDKDFLDAYVYAASLASNFGKTATGTNIIRRKA